MARKKYDSYQYNDPDNIYTYPNSSVLINKIDEKDPQKARIFEYQNVASQALRVISRPILVENWELCHLAGFLSTSN
ncbi:hypothetical protein [Lactovum odontotermitis]